MWRVSAGATSGRVRTPGRSRSTAMPGISDTPSPAATSSYTSVKSLVRPAIAGSKPAARPARTTMSWHAVPS
jgi:hypothetical protein